jgi:hypothetical protein
MNLRTLARRRLIVPLAVVLASLGAAAGLYAAVAPAGASASVWYVSRLPKLRVDVAAGCPKSVQRYQDVVNTFSGPPLAPAGPSAGLICSYKPALGASSPGSLSRQVRLTEAEARQLAAAVRKLALAPPRGIMSCPAAFGSVSLIGFSYPHRADVGLWYQTSGCQSLDNGRIGSFQGANPSFYIGFQDAVSRYLPGGGASVSFSGWVPLSRPAALPRSVPLPVARVLPQPVLHVRAYAVAR